MAIATLLLSAIVAFLCFAQLNTLMEIGKLRERCDEHERRISGLHRCLWDSIYGDGTKKDSKQ
jgi:hypothetical protein